MTTTGVIVARFQFATIPGSVRKMVYETLQAHDKLAIVLGVNKTGSTRRNPIDQSLRERMVGDAFPAVSVFTLEDHPSDETWSVNLDQLIDEFVGDRGVVVYGSEDGFVCRYHGKHQVRSLGESGKPEKIGRPLMASEEMRKGIVYGLQRTYPKVFPTVDIAVFRSNRKEILLGMKGIERKWRFPGGFADPEDESFEAAVRRELMEECGLTEISNLKYEASFRIDDWRYRNEEDKIVTLLFSAELVAGKAVAGDDIAEVNWFSLRDIGEMSESGMTAAEHRPLFRHLLGKYKA